MSLSELLNSLNIDNIWDIPLDDPDTYSLLAEGKTIGVFQLETPLGRSRCKQLKPEIFEQIAGLTAALRPGVLHALDDEGVSMTAHYIKRKNGEEPVSYYHPLLEPIMKETFGIMLYQEQMMEIGRVFADFDLLERDRMRKAAGKKDATEMNEIMKIFVDRASKKGVFTPEQAQQVAEWIKESARYLFNKAHSYGYGMEAYVTAFLKAHMPIKFFRSWLSRAESGPDSQDKIEDLVEDAKYFNINTYAPCILRSDDNFSIINEEIWFGIGNVKEIGESTLVDIRSAIQKAESKLNKKLNYFTYLEILFELDMPRNAMCNLIAVGAFRELFPQRKLPIYHIKNLFINKTTKLSTGELKWCKENLTTAYDLIPFLRNLARPKSEGGGVHNADKGIPKLNSLIDILENPPFDTKDYLNEMVEMETNLLGVSLTCAATDNFCDTTNDTTINEFLRGKSAKQMIFSLEIRDIREYTIERGNSAGRDMAFCKVKDSTGSCDAVIYSDQWEVYRDEGKIYKGVVVLALCEKSNKGDSLVIKKIRILQ